MSAYGRALAIPSPNETLVKGVGAMEGSGPGTSGQVGAGVGMTGKGGIGS